MNFSNKLVLITGASSGIGEATAREIARRGGQPLLVARRQEELERVAAAIQDETGVTAILVRADVLREEDRKKVAQAVQKNGGELQVLINNAGITQHSRFDETDLDVLRKTMELNFFSMAALTQILLPYMKKTQGEKVILLVSTISGLYGVPGRFAYSASKAAGHALMESLRIELKKYKIYPVIFCPGWVKTALRSSGLAGDGSIIKEADAPGALSPEEVALKLCNTAERKKRLAMSGFNGYAVNILRLLSRSLLENKMAKKLQHDYREKGEKID